MPYSYFCAYAACICVFDDPHDHQQSAGVPMSDLLDPAPRERPDTSDQQQQQHDRVHHDRHSVGTQRPTGRACRLVRVHRQQSHCRWCSGHPVHYSGHSRAEALLAKDPRLSWRGLPTRLIPRSSFRVGCPLGPNRGGNHEIHSTQPGHVTIITTILSISVFHDTTRRRHREPFPHPRCVGPPVVAVRFRTPAALSSGATEHPECAQEYRMPYPAQGSRRHPQG